jgi:hypothetical protein
MNKRGLLSAAGAFLLLTGAAHASHGGGVMVSMPGISMQPHKDQVCVADSVEVGDRIRNRNGDRLTVKTLSGKSLMCKQSNAPILAEVEFTASGWFHSTLSIELPEGYVQQDLTEKEKFDGNRLRAYNKATETTIRVQSWDGRHLGLGAMIDQNRKDQAKSGPVTQTAVEELAIHGVTAARWETETKPRGLLAPHVTVMNTLLQGDERPTGESEMVGVIVQGPTRKITPIHDQLQAVAETVVGLGKETVSP